MAELFAGKEWQTFLQILPTIPFETWETVWSTVVATLLALVIGLPLGVCLVTGEQGGVRPLPRWLMALLNGLVNLLRSVPFLILMIIVIPLSRAIVGTSIGTVASIVPLVIASFPFVSRLVETSMREVDAGVIEAAQSMGATPLQIITKVMVPESMPSLVANVTIAATTIMGYGAMAGIIGGGGIGLPYRPEESFIDYDELSAGIKQYFEAIMVPRGLGKCRLSFECGRAITGPYGYLVTTAIHHKHIWKEYIGVDASMANLMRPGMYGSYHYLSVMGKEDAPKDHVYDVVGSLCENCDKFAVDRSLPEIEDGDILVIHDTGAHGHSLGRTPPSCRWDGDSDPPGGNVR